MDKTNKEVYQAAINRIYEEMGNVPLNAENIKTLTDTIRALTERYRVL